MRKLENAVTLFTLAGLLFSAGTTSAQDPMDAGIFADEAGTQSTLTVEPYVPFDIYVVAFGLDGGLRGFEFELDGDEGLTILLSTPADGPRPINVADNPGEWIVGYLACLTTDPVGPFALVRFNLGSFSDPTGANLIDKAICLRGSTPSSFEQFGSPPGWLRCDGTLHPFGVAQNGGGVYPDGCLILNPTSPGSVVSNDTTSFGAMKTRF